MTQSKDSLRVALYARVSSERQAQAATIASQRPDFRICRRNKNGQGRTRIRARRLDIQLSFRTVELRTRNCDRI